MLSPHSAIVAHNDIPCNYWAQQKDLPLRILPSLEEEEIKSHFFTKTP
jgi:hypothetical protein